MKPATFQVGERIFQGASNTSFTASGFIKNWDPNGRVVSVEITRVSLKLVNLYLVKNLLRLGNSRF